MLTYLHRKPGFAGIFGLDAEGREVSIPEDMANADYASLVAGDLLPPPAPPSKAELIAHAVGLRWRFEGGGIEVGGVPIATDDRSKLMIAGARIAAAADPAWSTVWAGADGEVYPVDAAAMIAISDAVQAHVSAVFSAFAAIRADIVAGTLTTPAEVASSFAALV